MVIRFFLFPKFKQFLYLKVIEIVEISGFFFVLRTLKDLMFGNVGKFTSKIFRSV